MSALDFYASYSADEITFLQKRNKPEWVNRTEPDNLFLWQAFRQLTRSRDMNGNIPISEINAYCAFAGVESPVQRAALLSVVTALNERKPTNAPSPSH